jgi:hypothetical protein
MLEVWFVFWEVRHLWPNRPLICQTNLGYPTKNDSRYYFAEIYGLLSKKRCCWMFEMYLFVALEIVSRWKIIGTISEFNGMWNVCVFLTKNRLLTK